MTFSITISEFFLQSKFVANVCPVAQTFQKLQNATDICIYCKDGPPVDGIIFKKLLKTKRKIKLDSYSQNALQNVDPEDVFIFCDNFMNPNGELDFFFQNDPNYQMFVDLFMEGLKLRKANNLQTPKMLSSL